MTKKKPAANAGKAPTLERVQTMIAYVRDAPIEDSALPDDVRIEIYEALEYLASTLAPKSKGGRPPNKQNMIRARIACELKEVYGVRLWRDAIETAIKLTGGVAEDYEAVDEIRKKNPSFREIQLGPGNPLERGKTGR